MNIAKQIDWKTIIVFAIIGIPTSPIWVPIAGGLLMLACLALALIAPIVGAAYLAAWIFA